MININYMIYLFVRHKVADYKEWERNVDGHAGVRKDAGLPGRETVPHSATDPSE